MSLLVWMPFNGNLNNQGTGQVTVKWGTPSYVNGVTYKANQNATLVMSCPELKGVSIFTWCFFGKIVKTTVDWADMAWLATCKTDFTDGSRIRFEGYTGSPNISWYGNNDYYIAKGAAPDLGVKDQIFHHFALVADGSHVYTYVDGDLKSTYEQQDSANPNPAGKVRGCLYGDFGVCDTGLESAVSDLRIYDEPLSPRVIKEISRGMFLHFPLNDLHGGATNYLIDSASYGVSEMSYAKMCTYPTADKDGSTFTDYNCGGGVVSDILPAGNYVLSFMGKADVDNSEITIHLYDTNCITATTTSQGKSKSGNNDGNTQVTLSTNWKRYWVRFTQTAATKTQRWILPRLWNKASLNGKHVYIKDIRLSEGDTAPHNWIPNPKDALYTTMHYNEQTVQETSGICVCNGTASNSCKVTCYESPVRDGAMYFNGKSCVLFTLPSTNDFYKMTLMAWIKTSTYNSTAPNIINLGQNSGIRFRLQGSQTAPTIETLIHGMDDKITSFYVSTPWLADGNWHHVAVKILNGNLYVYTDGVLRGSKNLGTTQGVRLTNTYGCIGAYSGTYNESSVEESFVGYIADVRAYGAFVDDSFIANYVKHTT
jgi:hypothetical protein